MGTGKPWKMLLKCRIHAQTVVGVVVAQDPAPPKCPTKCSDGSPMKNIKAKSAYMVSKPGDVKSMQQEIMTNGPVEVAFFVYSDFQTYQSGVYRRTKSMQCAC